MLLVIAILFSAEVGFGDTFEVKSMGEVLPFVEEGSLLVFDIDNTLLEPTTFVGSDQWYYYLFEAFKNAGLSDPISEANAQSLWNQTQFGIEVKTVETATPSIIQDYQKQGIQTMAVTARTWDIADQTLRQLQSIQLSFENHSPSKEEQCLFTREELSTYDDVYFKGGVIFVGESNSKGVVFSKYLQKFGISPKRVVYVDDKEKHVKSMEVALRELQIPYFGFRYGAIDEKVKAFKAMWRLP